MRIAKKFGERTTEVNEPIEPKIKYFLAFEGEKTEHQYFLGIKNHRKELNIEVLHEIIPLERRSVHKTWSNPCKYIRPLIEYLGEASSGKISIKTIVEHSIDFSINDLRILKSKSQAISEVSSCIYDKLSSIGYSKDSEVEDPSEILEYICQCLYENDPDKYNDKILDRFEKYISEQRTFYDETSDKVCLIFDRDDGSLNTDQYHKLINACQKRNFSIYVSNPCFELWLLMHFDKIFDLDRNELLENRVISNAKRFLEAELGSQLGRYKKNNIRFERFADKVNNAIKNEESFCEDVDQLESKLGSNVGLLIKELQNGNNK